MGVATGILLHHLIAGSRHSILADPGLPAAEVPSIIAAAGNVADVDGEADDGAGAAESNKADVQAVGDGLAAIAFAEEDGSTTRRSSIGESPVLSGGSKLVLDD